MEVVIVVVFVVALIVLAIALVVVSTTLSRDIYRQETKTLLLKK